MAETDNVILFDFSFAVNSFFSSLLDFFENLITPFEKGRLLDLPFSAFDSLRGQGFFSNPAVSLIHNIFFPNRGDAAPASSDTMLFPAHFAALTSGFIHSAFSDFALLSNTVNSAFSLILRDFSDSALETASTGISSLGYLRETVSRLSADFPAFAQSVPKLFLDPAITLLNEAALSALKYVFLNPAEYLPFFDDADFENSSALTENFPSAEFLANALDFSFHEILSSPAVISTPEFNVFISADGYSSENAFDAGEKILDFADNIKDIVTQSGLRDTLRYGLNF